jgi:gamma-tubulin complex component 2
MGGGGTSSGNMSRQRLDDRPKPLGTHPVEIQELLLIEDLLFAMSGIEGVYIKRRLVQSTLDSSIIKNEFAVEPNLSQSTCDFSLLFLVNKVLPLC